MKNIIRTFALGFAVVALSFNNVRAQDAGAPAASTESAAPAAAETTVEGTLKKGEGDAWTLVTADNVTYKLAGDKLAELADKADQNIKATGAVSGDAEKTLTITSYEVVPAAAPEEAK